LVAGQLDVLPTVAKTPARETLADFSVPHTETFDAFFVRVGQPTLPNLAAAAGKEIVVVRADVAYEQLLERHLAGKVIPVNSIQDGLRLIAAGRHDAFLCSKIVGVLAAKEDGIQGVQAGPPEDSLHNVRPIAVEKVCEARIIGSVYNTLSESIIADVRAGCRRRPGRRRRKRLISRPAICNGI
jgi:ABC-type amino acid transport substrate-binding protein